MLYPGSCKKGMEEPGLNLGLSPKSHVLFSGNRETERTYLSIPSSDIKGFLVAKRVLF